MRYYQEITIIPNAEVSSAHVLGSTFDILHKAFVTEKNANGSMFGISFPEYNAGGDGDRSSLGTKIRVFSKDELALQVLDLRRKLRFLCDYEHISNIRTIPTKTGFAVYVRSQPKFYGPSYIRRYAQRHGIDEQRAIELLHKAKKKRKVQIPFINTKSHSSGQKFCLFIKKEKADTQNIGSDGAFSCYGLSRGGAVPEF